MKTRGEVAGKLKVMRHNLDELDSWDYEWRHHQLKGWIDALSWVLESEESVAAEATNNAHDRGREKVRV